MRWRVAAWFVVALIAPACTGDDGAPDGAGTSTAVTTIATTTSAPAASTPPSTTDVATTTTFVPSTTDVATTTTVLPTTRPFDVPVGPDGVTYDLRQPPSGPSSYVVLDDGSIVIADAAGLFNVGDVRLLPFAPDGRAGSPVSMLPHEVRTIYDLATDGRRLAVLDVNVAIQRDRVLVVELDGSLVEQYVLPLGWMLGDGLSGVVWDDLGILVEMQGGAWFGRVGPDGVQRTTQLVFDGLELEILPTDTGASVTIGDATIDVRRDTPLGGVTLVGVAPDHTVVLVVDEVSTASDGRVRVLRRVQRYSSEADLLGEVSHDAGDHVVEGLRELELTADGRVARLVALADRLELRLLDV